MASLLRTNFFLSKKLVFTYLGVGLFLLYLLEIAVRNSGPPWDITDHAITGTLARIDIYMKQHNRVPLTLEQLPERDGYSNSILDKYGRQLLYDVDAEGVISITSLGQDGLPGGSGADGDVIRRFKTRNPDGSSLIGDPKWKVSGEIKDAP